LQLAEIINSTNYCTSWVAQKGLFPQT